MESAFPGFYDGRAGRPRVARPSPPEVPRPRATVPVDRRPPRDPTGAGTDGPLSDDPHEHLRTLPPERAADARHRPEDDPAAAVATLPPGEDPHAPAGLRAASSTTRPPGEAAPAGGADMTLAPEAVVPIDDTATVAMLVAGRYRLGRLLGRGSMGRVYQAHDEKLNRRVALKIPRFSGDADDPRVMRFYREARAAAALRHPNICPVHDVGEEAGVHFISMGYLEGEPLSRVLAREGRLGVARAATVVRTLALALAEAHDHGVIHRDIKPGNVVVDPTGEPILTDFGLARIADEPGQTQHTAPGKAFGTPAYMSPEQLRAESDLGPGTDVYSLGVLLFELLTGRLPFDGDLTRIIHAALHDPPPPVETLRPETPPELAAAARRAMAKTPAERFGSMREFADALAPFAEVPVTASVSALNLPPAAAAGVAPSSAAVPAASFDKRFWIIAAVVAGLTLTLLAGLAGYALRALAAP